MSFQQIIAGKVKLNGLGGIRRHMAERQRVKTNPNIDLERSHLNYCIEGLTPDNLNHRVNERIKQLNLKKKPRSDAVGLEDIIVSASADFMLNLDPHTRNQYFTDALHFFQNRYGKKNIMYCQCHLDESNPHIHIGIVPITADGHLSAKKLFSPKTLEQLQTDFHNTVSSKYGLERGEYHAKKYLPLQQFKAKQAKLEIKKFTQGLDISRLDQNRIRIATESAHHPFNGLIIKTEDEENITMPTKNFEFLKDAAQNGVKAVAIIDSLKSDINNLERDNAVLKNESNEHFHQLRKIEKQATSYLNVPKGWRKNIDIEIDKLQVLFSKYCHDVNRSTAKVFIATNCNFKKTTQIMQGELKHIGVKDSKKYIHDVFIAVRKQCKKHITPDTPEPSWKTPKPEQTDYQQPDETGMVGVDLVQLGGDDINWDMINWDLLSDLEKRAIKIKLMIRELG